MYTNVGNGETTWAAAPSVRGCSAWSSFKSEISSTVVPTSFCVETRNALSRTGITLAQRTRSKILGFSKPRPIPAGPELVGAPARAGFGWWCCSSREASDPERQVAAACGRKWWPPVAPLSRSRPELNCTGIFTKRVELLYVRAEGIPLHYLVTSYTS